MVVTHLQTCERAPVDTAERHGVSLLGEPRDVSVARAFVRCVLGQAATAGGLDSAVLVVSELVTVAVVSNSGPVGLEVAVHSDRAILYVRSGRAVLPWLPAPGEERPQWMQVVDRLTIDWWLETDGRHTTSTALVSLRPRERTALSSVRSCRR